MGVLDRQNLSRFFAWPIEFHFIYIPICLNKLRKRWHRSSRCQWYPPYFRVIDVYSENKGIILWDFHPSSSQGEKVTLLPLEMLWRMIGSINHPSISFACWIGAFPHSLPSQDIWTRFLVGKPFSSSLIGWLGVYYLSSSTWISLGGICGWGLNLYSAGSFFGRVTDVLVVLVEACWVPFSCRCLDRRGGCMM